MSSSPSSAAGAAVHRVQSTAPTLRRVAHQQHPQASLRKQQKTIAKLTLGSPYQLPTHILSLNDSLQVLDLLTNHFSQLRVAFIPPARGKRGLRRRLARAQLKAQHSQAAPPMMEEETQSHAKEDLQPPLVEEKKEKEEEGGLTEHVPVTKSGVRTLEGSAQSNGFTFGLNAVTRALEAALSSPTLPLSSPYSLLLLVSSHPPSLSSHFTHFSHHLHLPLLTLHSSISSTQFAHTLSPTLSSLLALAIHTVAPSSPFSPLLPLLVPFSRVLRIPWLECEDGLEKWRGLRVEVLMRTAERQSREDGKRRKKEEELRKSRPLSPKSIAAKVFQEKERAKREAAAKTSAATDQGTADVSTVTPS